MRPLVGEEADKGVFLPLTQQDWIKASLEGLKPVRAGRVLVHGSHDREQRRPNDLAIEIEAALAFGTGHHGTTKSCLLAFIDELKQRRPRRVLDVGTGTGILAFAAAKTLKRRVVAGDIDPEAVRVARENARLNGIDRWLTLYVGPGVPPRGGRSPRIFRSGLCEYPRKAPTDAGPSLARVATPDGTLILSGLLARDVPGVLSAYEPQGFGLQRRYDLEGWAALVLKRGGAHPRPRRSH